MNENKICPVCDSSFIASRSDQLYCQQRCYQAQYFKTHKPQNNVELVRRQCKFCLKSFTPTRGCNLGQKFCSDSCKTNDHALSQKLLRAKARENVCKLCPICETKFSPRKSMREIYCSPKCRKAIGRRIYKMMDTCYKSTKTKKSNSSHKVLGYTPNQLLEHLQKTANWAKIKDGEWHLDHIFPIIAFVRKGILDLKLICCLDNLQPLSGRMNCSKNDNYDINKFENWLRDRA